MRPGGEGEIAGEVMVVERLGGETFLYTQLEDGAMLVVQADGEIPTGVHERVAVKLDPATCHLFDAEGLAVERLSAIRWPTCAGCRPARRADAGEPGRAEGSGSQGGLDHGPVARRASTTSSSAAEAPAAWSPAASSPSMAPGFCLSRPGPRKSQPRSWRCLRAT